MSNEFFVKHKTGETQKGLFWLAEKPKANIVGITGMQETASRYERFAKFFNSNGYNVYMLDALGQGLNAPTVADLQKWPKDGFVKNVDAVALTVELVKKEFNLPTTVFGHSMGSFMIQSFLERYPDVCNNAIICGSNGPQKTLYKVAALLAKFVVNKNNWDEPCPFLTNLGTGAYSKQIPNRRTDLDWLSFDEANVDKYIADPYCGHPNTGGFWKGFLDGMNTIYRSRYVRFIRKDTHIFIVSGDSDPVGNMGKGPVALDKMYRRLGVKDVNLRVYDNMRHEILNEKDYMKVLRDLLSFLDHRCN